MPTRPLRVLTVCLGNICRSPTAEAALREAAAQRGVDIEVRSAGTGDWHVGAPPNPPMVAAAAEVGLTVDGSGAQVGPDDLAWADLVVAMDRHNLADLRRMAALAGVETPIRRFREFDPAAGDDLDVPDPYGGAADGFADVVAICRRTAPHVLDALTGDG
ncbi:MAG: low molecular weight phosphotyrosine protein phosphatase [Actinobacteria bacterium]|jgi:protein-tyrosine phosphatase|nr:low molecular weight phosphotyrosine protein phosphatase [Actinomycetota bacterium]